MKRLITLAAALFLSAALFAEKTPQKVQYVYKEATELNLVGKLMPTPNPYHRVDTVKYKGFTKGENFQVRCPAGMCIMFKTNSSSISVQADGDFSYLSNSTMRLSSNGYDLYIKDKNGKWLWAAATGTNIKNPEKPVTLIKNMPDGDKECMMYLPIYSELWSVRIGVEKGRTLEPLESDFRHRVAIFGSSFTHGISTSRAGMSYPMQFTRHTGIQMLSLGCSGNCKLQPYFADVLADVDADAFVFDSFSNPGADMIHERLFPFIEKLSAAHPGKPLIFQQTIYRESRNFNTGNDEFEAAKQHMADSLMKIAVKKYPDVYFIQTNATSPLHETSVDGTHPDDYGYYLWSRSIEKSLLKILKKYGIK